MLMHVSCGQSGCDCQCWCTCRVGRVAVIVSAGARVVWVEWLWLSVPVHMLDPFAAGTGVWAKCISSGGPLWVAYCLYRFGLKCPQKVQDFELSVHLGWWICAEKHTVYTGSGLMVGWDINQGSDSGRIGCRSRFGWLQGEKVRFQLSGHRIRLLASCSANKHASIRIKCRSGLRDTMVEIPVHEHCHYSHFFINSTNVHNTNVNI